jgi:hypothetical protein
MNPYRFYRCHCGKVATGNISCGFDDTGHFKFNYFCTPHWFAESNKDNTILKPTQAKLL